MIEKRIAGQSPSDGRLEFCSSCALRIEVKHGQDVVESFGGLSVVHVSCPLTVWTVELGPAVPFGQSDVVADYRSAVFFADQRFENTNVKPVSDWVKYGSQVGGCLTFMRTLNWPSAEVDNIPESSRWQLISQTVVMSVDS